MMILDMVLQETDGTEVARINLATSTALLLNYTPGTPEPRSVEWASPLRNGGTIAATTLADVTETAQSLLEEATDAAMLLAIQAMEAAYLAAAMRQQRKRGPRLFVELTLNRMVTPFQSEILRGKLQLDPGALDYGWRSRQMEITQSWTRRWFWEAAVDTALPLRSNLTAKTTAGVVVEGSLGRTWVEILGSDLPGVLPAPLRLQITNLDASLTGPSQIWVGRNETASPTTLNPIIEAEDASALYGNDIVVSASYSNGNAVEITPPLTASTSVTYELDSTFLSQFAGGPVKVIAKLPSTNTLVWMKIQVKYFVTLVGEGPEVLQTNDAIQDLGIIYLPPWNVPGGSVSQELTINLVTRSLSPVPFVLDFLHLMPLDGFVKYQSRGYGLQTGVTLVDDAIHDTLTATSGGEHAGFFIKAPAADGLLLTPGVDQRLYLLQNGVEDIDRQLQVQAWYRERRVTL